MEIKVKTITGTSFNYSVESDTTIGDMKSWMLSKTAIQPNQQRYIHCGRMLSDNQRVVDLPNAAAGMTLHMILSLRGG
jgi:hypothetical protein